MTKYKNLKNDITTLTDIAEMAGVTARTVDRAIHNRYGVAKKNKRKP